MKKAIAAVCVLGLVLFVISAAHAVYAAYSASDVIGQIDQNGAISFTQSAANNAPGYVGFNNPTGVAIDRVNHRLFVADLSNNRVVVYNLDSSNNISSRKQVYVLGQQDFFHSSTGNDAASMNLPVDVAYDAVNNRLYASDASNNRVLVFNVAPGTLATGMSATFVLGQTGFGAGGNGLTSSTLNLPEGVAFDSVNNRLFVADRFNDRVVVYNTANLATGMPASFVLGEPDFTTKGTGTTSSTLSNSAVELKYDSNNSRLFVMDFTNNRVLVWNVAPGAIANGMPASYVLGQSVFTTASSTPISSSTMSAPDGGAYDTATDRLFVADNGNKRILVFNVASGTIANGMPASFVLGQSVFTTATSTTSASGISGATSGDYDPATGRLFMGIGGQRILVWNAASGTIANGAAAVDVLGHLDSTGSPFFTKSTTNDAPNSFSFSVSDNQMYSTLDTVHHRLFVNDALNNRVLVYKLDSANNPLDHVADYVIGQADFDSNGSATTRNGLNFPNSLTYDSANDRLFVTDDNNNRVLVYDTSNLANGMNASFVLGQSVFTTASSSPISSSTLHCPEGLAYDTASNRLFTVDNCNNRILIFNAAPGTIANGMAASFVLGQSVFTTASTSVSSSTFAFSRDIKGLSYDQVNSRLFVTDDSGDRVLVWSVPVGSVSNGMPASYVIGQTGFGTTSSGLTSSTLNNPEATAYDASGSRLFVEDYGNNRVLVFNAATSTIANGESASFVIGQPDFTSNVTGVSRTTFGANPWGMGDYDPVNHRIYVGDGSNNRLLAFDLVRLTGGASAQVGTKGSSYSGSGFCATANSQGTVTCSASGNVPPGLTLDGTTGILSGTPTAAGGYSFTVIATDTVSGIGAVTDQQSYFIQIVDPASSNIIGSSSGGGGGGGGGSSGSGSSGSSGSGTPAPVTTPPVTPPGPETSALQTQIQDLLAKIADLKDKLGIPTGTGTDAGTGTGTGNSAPGGALAAPTITRNLAAGASGNDVKALEDFLAAEATGPAAAALKAHGTTHFFGTLTKAALIEFQKAHGIVPASGFLGPLTRAALNVATH